MKFPRILLCILWLAAAATPAVARAGLDDGLTAALPLSEDLRDHSKNNLPVKVWGKVALQHGSAYFPGDGNYLELPFVAMNEQDFAVSMWVCPTGDFPTYGLLQQKDSNVPNHLMHLLIREGLHPWLGFYVNDTVSPIGLTNAGEWQHVVFQYTRGAQEIWINGWLICRRQTEAYRGVSGATFIGRAPKWNNVPTRDFEGYLSGVRLYARALTGAEVRQLAQASPPAIKDAPAAAKVPARPAEVEKVTGDTPLLNINAGSMRVSGATGESYTLEASSDLQHWETLGTVTVGTEGTVDLVDKEATNFSQRFYRLRYRAREK